jgi:predicted metalloprotease with PDZ domain
MRFIAALAATVVCAPLFAQGPIPIRVDASDAGRRLFHVKMTMTAKTGPMTLLYPEWIPGEHGPTGPILNMVGLVITGGGKTIPWRRDDVNMFAYHVDVPAGVGSLDIAFDFISPSESSGFSSGASATTELAVVSWNQLLLYPEGANADSLQYQANLKLPNSWKFGTALPIRRETGAEIEFQPAALTTLIDSPLSAGAHYRTIDLGSDRGLPHYLHLAADSERALEAAPETIQGFKNLVQEEGALFQARHYRDYHFLLTLSDHVAHFGLEHHESSDDRVGERTLIDDSQRIAEGFLLPHEFTHSWNGKFRRAAGLAGKDGRDGGYDTPMKGELLWVYEGLTEYMGEVLTPRSALWTPEQYRDYLAITAASLDNEYGRRWRPLEDTAVAAQLLYTAPEDYNAYRRNVDYYPEGTLIWLEADVTIRKSSKGAKSLNDFCRTFYGGASGKPELKTYTFADVVAGLNAVQPYDWAGFFNQRLHSTSPHAPLGGVEGSGWKLTYDANRSDFWKSLEEVSKGADFSYSLGIRVRDEDGTISDVALESPAFKAGMAPAVKLIAINKRQYNSTLLREAIQAAAKDGKPIELMVKAGDFYQTFSIDYRGGERYPHLTRIESAPDLLSDIIAPLVKR